MKNKLRKQYKNIIIINKEYKDNLIIQNLKTLIKDYNKILIYYPIKNEVDIFKIIDNKKRFYLPFCINEEEMKIGLFKDKKSLIKDKCKILSSDVFSSEKIEVAIVPSIAMNNKGYRLGYGKGYYDRYLVNSNCIKIALVYEQCLINERFEEEWDIKFDYIVTENKIIEVK